MRRRKRPELAARPKIDRLEAAQNPRATIALQMFKDIFENLDRSEFTGAEIIEYFNSFIRYSHNRYGRKVLTWLVERGFIAPAGDDSYYVTTEGEWWYETGSEEENACI